MFYVYAKNKKSDCGLQSSYQFIKTYSLARRSHRIIVNYKLYQLPNTRLL